MGHTPVVAQYIPEQLHLIPCDIFQYNYCDKTWLSIPCIILVRDYIISEIIFTYFTDVKKDDGRGQTNPR